MLTFITDIVNPKEPDLLANNQHETLLIISLEGQLLGRYTPPKGGWSHETLCDLAECFPQQWEFCGADALIGQCFVGSTEI
ncbi:hypothetical protein VHA01S_080_00080 [Vibrio halioticoli NBRC 102217]|uniref:Uncharacterized protein n=1 Tax=Vibrio halioticoli NBRC 102217 TaxID=1219072 RepID=V5FHQ1_9VIBR|nr:hypothetical protein [Vibrio halioticoli]GAD91268.1 hypothetical protein VHA01S_080_00080 [Vibrio halioticoli NBRC 102217]